MQSEIFLFQSRIGNAVIMGGAHKFFDGHFIALLTASG